jgi:4-aminobutyrate aminotransferase-like enzyme
VLDGNRSPDGARAGRMIEQALARGLIVLSGGVDQNILSFTPPFVISAEEIYFALGVLAEIADAG